MKMKSLWMLPLSCLLCLHGGASSANAVINQFLAQAETSSMTQPLATEEFASGWIGESDLRYSGNDVDEQSLALRIRPRFKSERLAQQRINALLNRQNSFYSDERLGAALKRRYQRLLLLIEIASELEFLRQRNRLDADALKLNRSLVGAETFDAADLQTAELEYHHSLQQVTLLQNRLDRMMLSIGATRADELPDFLGRWREQVASWENFFQLNSELLRLHNSDRLVTNSDQLDFELAQQKLKLARSESRSWLKYVELKFDYRADSEQETTLGFAIPLGNDNAGMFERASDVTRASLELQSARDLLAETIQRNGADLDWYREQEMAMTKTRELLEQQQSRLAGAEQPKILLDLRRQMLNQEHMIQRNHLRALRDYIDLLHSAGYLTHKPLSNWLLRQQPRL